MTTPTDETADDQWTPEEVAALLARHLPSLSINRILVCTDYTEAWASAIWGYFIVPDQKRKHKQKRTEPERCIFDPPVKKTGVVHEHWSVKK